MKYIEMKSEGYTYRYDFDPIPTTNEAFDPNVVTYQEDLSNANLVLSICIDLVQNIFGEKKVKEALKEMYGVDCK